MLHSTQIHSTHLRDLSDTHCVLGRNTEHRKHSLAPNCKGQSEKNAFAERGYITSINPPPLPHHLPLLICFLNHLGVETNNDCAFPRAEQKNVFSIFFYLSPFPSFSLPPQMLRHQTTACSCCLWWWKEHSRDVNSEHFLFSYLFCWCLFGFPLSQNVLVFWLWCCQRCRHSTKQAQMGWWWR